MTKRVRLKPTSKWASILDPCNQPDAEGRIVNFDPEDDNLYLQVLWDCGIANWYSLEDLEQIND